MDFTIDGKEYKVGRLDAFRQMYVARRLAPALACLADLDKLDLAGLGVEFEADGSLKSLSLGEGVKSSELLRPITEALASLKDEDLEFVFNAFLEVTEVRHAGAWAPMRRNGQTMFQPELPELLQIGWQAMRANLANFTKSLPSLSGILSQLGKPAARA